MQKAVSLRLQGTKSQLEEIVAALRAAGTVRAVFTNERRLRGQEDKPAAEQEWFYDGILEMPLAAPQEQP